MHIQCIVESEKTAIIMSIICPDYLWLGTGSKSNFKEKLLRSFKDYNVIVYPDKSEIEDWNKKALKCLNKKDIILVVAGFLKLKQKRKVRV